MDLKEKKMSRRRCHENEKSHVSYEDGLNLLHCLAENGLIYCFSVDEGRYYSVIHRDKDGGFYWTTENEHDSAKLFSRNLTRFDFGRMVLLKSGKIEAQDLPRITTLTIVVDGEVFEFKPGPPFAANKVKAGGDWFSVHDNSGRFSCEINTEPVFSYASLQEFVKTLESELRFNQVMERREA